MTSAAAPRPTGLRFGGGPSRLARAIMGAVVHQAMRLVLPVYHGIAFRLICPRTPPEAARDWVIISFNSRNVLRNLIGALAFRFLARRGWHAKPLFSGGWLDHLIRPGDPIGGSLRVGANGRSCRLADAEPDEAAWTVDLARQRIEACGCDFYPLIEATVSNLRHVYATDLSDPSFAPIVEDALASAAAMLTVAIRLERAADAGKRIAICLNEVHTVPNGVLATYFQHPARWGKVTIYITGPAYALYYAKTERSCDVLMTRMARPNVVHPIYVTSEEFEPWFGGLSDDAHAAIDREVSRFVLSTEIRKQIGSHSDAAIHDRIMSARAAKVPVYCLFSNFTYDRFANDGTVLFESMIEWIRATIEAFRDMDGLLLLKPHIAEGYRSGASAAKLRLADIVADMALPDNVVLLPMNQYLASETFDILDAAIIWRSTAYLEMVMAGVPAIFCGPNSYFKEPLNLSPPSILEAYKARLVDLPNCAPSDDERRRAAAVLYYLNRIRVVPLEIMTHVLDDIQAISPWRLAKLCIAGQPAAEELGETILHERLGAVGPLLLDGEPAR